jgi:hypothetical protein
MVRVGMDGDIEEYGGSSSGQPKRQTRILNLNSGFVTYVDCEVTPQSATTQRRCAPEFAY